MEFFMSLNVPIVAMFPSNSFDGSNRLAVSFSIKTLHWFFILDMMDRIKRNVLEASDILAFGLQKIPTDEYLSVMIFST